MSNQNNLKERIYRRRMKGDKDGKPILSYDKIHDIPNQGGNLKTKPIFLVLSGLLATQTATPSTSMHGAWPKGMLTDTPTILRPR